MSATKSLAIFGGGMALAIAVFFAMIFLSMGTASANKPGGEVAGPDSGYLGHPVKVVVTLNVDPAYGKIRIQSKEPGGKWKDVGGVVVDGRTATGEVTMTQEGMLKVRGKFSYSRRSWNTDVKQIEFSQAVCEAPYAWRVVNPCVLTVSITDEGKFRVDWGVADPTAFKYVVSAVDGSNCATNDCEQYREYIDGDATFHEFELRDGKDSWTQNIFVAKLNDRWLQDSWGFHFGYFGTWMEPCTKKGDVSRTTCLQNQ